MAPLSASQDGDCVNTFRTLLRELSAGRAHLWQYFLFFAMGYTVFAIVVFAVSARPSWMFLSLDNDYTFWRSLISFCGLVCAASLTYMAIWLGVSTWRRARSSGSFIKLIGYATVVGHVCVVLAANVYFLAWFYLIASYPEL